MKLKSISSKRILITGGTGSFGTYILKELTKINNFKEIIVFSRDEDRHSAGVGFQVVLVIKMTGVSAAHMHNALDVTGQSIETALETLHTEVQRHFNISCEQGFVDLDVFATGFGQRANLEID